MIEHGKNSAEKKSIFKLIAKASEDAEKEARKIEKIGETIDYKNGLSCEGRKDLDFTSFKRLEDFANGILYGNISIKRAKKLENKMELKITDFKTCNPRIQGRKTSRETNLDNAQKLFEGRNMVIEAFEDGTFRLLKRLKIQNLIQSQNLILNLTQKNQSRNLMKV